MASRLLVFCCISFQVAQSQFYSVPAPNYNYSPTLPASPIIAPPYYYPTAPPRQSSPPSPKRSISTPLTCPKCSPSSATAYFLSTPSEKVKATVLTRDNNIIKKTDTVPPPVYSCPLCNGFADVPPSSKLPPPPPIGSPVLPGILGEIPTKNLELLVKDLVKELSTIDPSSFVPPKVSPVSDMYEKQKLSKKLSFDQELLEGFLTGLGITT